MGWFVQIIYLVGRHRACTNMGMSYTMIGENQQLVTDELVEFEK